MKLDDLGYNKALAKYVLENSLGNYVIGRIISEHKERYILKTVESEFEAEITGNLRFTAQSREDFPAVGDWVAITTYDPGFAIIHHIFPRFSMIKRQAVGQFGEIQIIATNVDLAFIIQAADRDFNINRLERYLTICNTSRVKPIIVLSKIDLIDEQRINEIEKCIRDRIPTVPLIAISNESQTGYDTLYTFIEKGKSYCMLGSSGVGKSTLLNNLSGKNTMKTGIISDSTHKGRHVTSHRELIILENGGILIDNPGMREVGIADATNGLELTFESIYRFSKKCKFKDCRHVLESGCAVVAAVENGEIDQASYENYLKMEKEKVHFESTLEEKRKKEKEFGKMVKNYKKIIKEASNDHNKFSFFSLF
jgi:ribosome biogenesis GTPase / thiamine phosphate phosphatase